MFFYPDIIMDFTEARMNYCNHFHGHTNLIENIIQNLSL
jgi:hypothetical protein